MGRAVGVCRRPVPFGDQKQQKEDTEVGKRVAVVTGAASGIGAACAEVLVEQGYDVVMTDVTAAALEEKARGIGARWHVLDVTDEAATEALAQELFAAGGVDALVASAGVLQSPLPPHQLLMTDWDRVMQVDLRGLYLSCRSFGTLMARAGRGAMVTISSCAGLRSTPLHAYGPAKAAVISLTETLAAEWGRSGVRVNGVAPAFTLTEAIRERARIGERDLSAFSRDHLIGRAIEPREIAGPVAFLLSDAASAITGVTLPVDGGLLAGGVWASYGGCRAAYPKD